MNSPWRAAVEGVWLLDCVSRMITGTVTEMRDGEGRRWVIVAALGLVGSFRPDAPSPRSSVRGGPVNGPDSSNSIPFPLARIVSSWWACKWAVFFKPCAVQLLLEKVRSTSPTSLSNRPSLCFLPGPETVEGGDLPSFRV